MLYDIFYKPIISGFHFFDWSVHLHITGSWPLLLNSLLIIAILFWKNKIVVKIMFGAYYL